MVDFTIAGKIGFRSYWEMLQQIGLLYGNFPKPSKTYLVVKEQCVDIELFRGSEVKITTDGKNI